MAMPYIIEADDSGERTYEIFSKLLTDRIIFLDSEFSSDMANSIVAQLLYLNSADPDKDIYMYINSPGGSISAMYAIFDTMRHISPDINTVGLGSVASAGSMILAAGTKGKRSALPNTEIMIHELSSGVQGKAGDIFSTTDYLKNLYTKMAYQYAELTGQKPAKLKKDMKRDFYMSAEEAVEYGLIDFVVE